MRFTPWAWAKFLFLRDAGDTEVGGFGISCRTDPLRIVDVVLVPQRASMAFVTFDDAAVADHFDQQVDTGRTPEEFARIWLHTHPGHSPQPSPTDERTFSRVFAGCDWAIMGILARGGASYARLHFSAGPSGSFRIPVEVDYEGPFAASDEEAWRAEYQRCVQTMPFPQPDDGLDASMHHVLKHEAWPGGNLPWLDSLFRQHDPTLEPECMT